MEWDDVYEELLVLVSNAGVRVDTPIESEQLFQRMVKGFLGTRRQLLDHIATNLPKWFRCANERPAWIQEAEGQFEGDAPMIFLAGRSICNAASFMTTPLSMFSTHQNRERRRE
jgi:hypothetical protein